MSTHPSDTVKRTLAAVERVSDVIGPLPEWARGNVIFVAWAVTNGQLQPEIDEMVIMRFLTDDAIVSLAIASQLLAGLRDNGAPETARILEAKLKQADCVPVMAIIPSQDDFVLAELRYCYVSAGGSA